MSYGLQDPHDPAPAPAALTSSSFPFSHSVPTKLGSRWVLRHARCTYAWEHLAHAVPPSWDTLLQRLTWLIPSSPLSPWLNITALARPILSAHFKMTKSGAPGYLSQLSTGLQLRSWSHSSWIWAPHQAMCWTAQRLEPTSDSASPSLCPSLTRILCLSFSQK